MFGLFRRGMCLGTAGLVASIGIANVPTPISENTMMTAPSKYISMASRMSHSGFKLNEDDREELDQTLMYLFQSRIFESGYHSLYLCYPQNSSVFLSNWGYSALGSLVFDNHCWMLICFAFLTALVNMNALFIAN
mmetsp:Transcript_43421/g.71713  ORF Transcript_43421/g.71713 Transcript_43421/m.71713 type:complete len:135 (+) Transcript_43421:72-476(+)